MLAEVEAIHLPSFNLSKYLNYDLQANEKLDRLVDGYTIGYKLEKVLTNPELELVEQIE